MSVVLQSSGGGSVTLQEPATASNYTLSLPARTGTAITSADSATVTQGMLASGVAGTGPAFSVIRASSNQSFTSGVETKVQFNSEEFDTNNNFDSTTNYRFTPTVAGYYLITINLYIRASSAMTSAFAVIYKNGATWVENGGGVPSGAYWEPSTSVVVYLNGSTDYIEGYVASNATSPYIDYASVHTRMTGCLLRGA